MPLDPEFLELLDCPECRQSQGLVLAPEGLRCDLCGVIYAMQPTSNEPDAVLVPIFFRLED